VAEEVYAHFSDKEWIEFLRVVVEMHVGYVEKEKAALSVESKDLLRSLVMFLRDAKGIEFEEITALYDGQFKDRRTRCREGDITIFPGELTRIFPNEIDQAIQHGRGLMEAYIRKMNERLTEPLSLDIAKELVDEIMETGLERILSHLHEVDHLWYDRRLHWESTSWAHTRSLVTAVEDIGKHWFKGRKLDSVLSKAFGSNNPQGRVPRACPWVNE